MVKNEKEYRLTKGDGIFQILPGTRYVVSVPAIRQDTNRQSIWPFSCEKSPKFLHNVTSLNSTVDTVSGRTHLSGKQENLEFHVWAEPADVNRGFDENYLRNALGYLRDCQQQGLEPSIFQMALFGWLSDTLFVAFPFYVPIWMLVLIQNFLGRVIGKKLLGYAVISFFVLWFTSNNNYLIVCSPPGEANIFTSVMIGIRQPMRSIIPNLETCQVKRRNHCKLFVVDD